METQKQLAEKIYNLSSILKQHCKTNEENLEEVAIISTLAECIHKNADRLNVQFINAEIE